ncbi:hypothetical protein K7G98_16580, partial [Saccharothrix sp. MB29]|nr:hypothetical protein [Saccharothrix sp. MB29]
MREPRAAVAGRGPPPRGAHAAARPGGANPPDTTVAAPRGSAAGARPGGRAPSPLLPAQPH